MKVVNKLAFFSGIFVLLILFFSYFINLNVDVGDNYIVQDTLLGIIIFHNIFILSFYLLIALTLLFVGIKKVRLV